MKKEATYSLSSHFVLMLVCSSMILIMMTGCKKNGDNSLIIDLDRNDEVSIFDLVDSISVVKLETNSDCLFNRIKNIIFHKNKYYFFDKSLQSLFCFDKAGNFQLKINKLGRGPNEYEYTEFVNIDEFNNQLLFLESWGQILFFDLDGSFIEKRRLPEEIICYNEVYSVDKDILLFISLNENRASYYSRSKNKLLKTFLKITKEQRKVYPPIDRTYKYGDSIYFRDDVNSNIVINLSDTTNRISYTWNFGKNNNTEKQLHEFYLYKIENGKKGKSIDWEEVEKNKKYMNYFPGLSFESKKYRGMSLTFNGVLKYVLYNKNNNKYFVFSKTIEGVKPYMVTMYDNSIVNFYTDKNDPLLNKILTEKQKKIIESHDPNNDNPFLVIYHIK